MNKNSNMYKVPEGYFEQLQSRLEAIPAQQECQSEVVSPWGRVRPYLALAACFLMIVCVGNFVIGRSFRSADDSISFEDICYADLIPVTNPYMIYEDSPYSAYDVQDAVSEDDVVEYLISSGASVDYIAYLLNE